MEKLREWLTLTQISVVQLAKEIGVHPNSMHNYLDGKTSPNGYVLRKIHNRTDIPLDDLVPKN